jgi:hypothetical protein
MWRASGELSISGNVCPTVSIHRTHDSQQPAACLRRRLKAEMAQHSAALQAVIEAQGRQVAALAGEAQRLRSEVRRSRDLELVAQVLAAGTGLRQPAEPGGRLADWPSCRTNQRRLRAWRRSAASCC